MSGITGIFYQDGRQVDKADLQRMVDAIAHRGPDGGDTWSDEGIGLGHRMLWTTPESLREKLPLASESGGLVITADARIDNRDELWSALGNRGQLTRDTADSELILAAYRKWGESCPEHLLGDFAFAIWDARRRTLFCARDHFGVRPLYYYQSRRIIAFASELKSILCVDEVPRRLNELKVADYLTSTFDDEEDTIFQDIKRLPAAHSLSMNRNGIELRRYWSLDPSKELRLGSDQEYTERFKELFSESVRCRLRGAYPVGSFLSGGLDSSSVTCVARDLLREKGGHGLSTYSAIFDNVKESDERPYINAVLSQGGVKPNFVHGDETSPLADHDRILWHQDEPLYAFNHSLNWGIYEVAHNQGVRIMLDGFDGDSTVSHGAGYLVELARSWQWPKLYSEIRGFSKNFGQSPWSVTRKLAWTHNISPMIPNTFRTVGKRLIRRASGSSGAASEHLESISVLNEEFAKRLDVAERRRSSQKPFPLTERESHYLTLRWAVLPYTLEVLNKSASAFSIEPRYPFFDRRLVEYCLSLPGHQKMRKGWSRMVMRRAMAGILPNEVQWRIGKANIGHNFKYIFEKFENQSMNDVVLRNPNPIQNYVNMGVLSDAFRRVQSQTSSHNDVLTIWKAMTLALWLRKIGVVTQVSRHEMASV